MKKLLISLFTAALALSATAFADFDPIDNTVITYADYVGVTIPKSATALFSKLYAAEYDEEGRLVNVSSAPIEYIEYENESGFYPYSDLGIDEDIIKSGTKLMLWSTFSSDMRPAKNTYILEDLYYSISSYGTASNNPTMVVKKIIPTTNDDGETLYTVVGYSSGGEVRYTTKANTLVAKMTEPFNGSSYYIGENLWRADLDLGTEFTELIQPGDIVGVQDNGYIFLILTSAQELIDGVKSNDIPQLYNMCNFGRSIARDNIIMGGVKTATFNQNYGFISTHGYQMGMDLARSIDVITVSENGEITVDNDNVAMPMDLELFNEETGKGDYLFARYAHRGALQDFYIYRFE